jgi:tetratricopeptide (TPR) repeat protein
MTDGSIFSTVDHIREPDNTRTPRQQTEWIASVTKDPTTTVSNVTDITFAGTQASMLEAEFTSRDTKLRSIKKLAIFGKPGEYTTFNVIFAKDNATDASAGERMFRSVLRAGTVASETSLYPPINWTRQEFAGLFFDTPSTDQDPNCKSTEIAQQYTAMTRCFRWGKDLTLKVGRRIYPSGKAPAADSAAREELNKLIEIEKEFPTLQKKERSISSFAIPGAEGARLREFTSLGTVGSAEETFFIRRGGDFWTVTIFHFIERKATELATRIVSSIGFTQQPAPVTTPSPEVPQQGAQIANAAGFISAGELLAAKGEHQQAVLQYAQAIRLEPENGRALFQKAFSLERLGRFDEAINDYSGAIKFKYSLREAHFNRGTLLYHQKRYLSAILDLASAIKIDPVYVAAYYNRGLANHAFNQLDSALADFNKVIDLDQKHINARIMRSRIYCQKGLVMSAIAEQDSVIALGGTIERGCSR